MSSRSFVLFALLFFVIGFFAGFVGNEFVGRPPFSEMSAQAPEEQAPEPILETCEQQSQPAVPAPTIKRAAARPQPAVKKQAVDTSTAVAFDGLGPPQ